MTHAATPVGSGATRPARCRSIPAALFLAATAAAAPITDSAASHPTDVLAPDIAAADSAATADAVASEPASAVRRLRLRDADLRALPAGLLPRWAADVRFSPDRRWLAYLALDADDPAGAWRRLWIVRVDATGRRSISPSGAWPEDPSWSPDGRSIVYVDGHRLAVVDIASGGVRHLRGVRAGRIWLPSFHPDGRTILYTRTARRGERLELWTVPVRGGSPRRLARDAAYGTWSPDGSTIAFRRFGRAVAPGQVWPYRTGRLDLMDGDGRNVRTVIESGGSMMAPIDWSQVRPEWSPDGTRLVYATLPGWDASLRVLELRGRHVIQVGCGALPTWFDFGTLLLERSAPCGASRRAPSDVAALSPKE